VKHLHEKNEQYAEPSVGILDTFPSGGISRVILTQKEFTSLCPLTKQPDYCTIRIEYAPKELCVESKSLKLYLSSYRNVGAFAETLARRIGEDLFKVLSPRYLSITVQTAPRGGIDIEATARVWGRTEAGDNG